MDTRRGAHLTDGELAEAEYAALQDYLARMTSWEDLSYDIEQEQQDEYGQSAGVLGGALYVASVTRPELSQCLFAGSCAIKAVKHGAKASAVTTKMADKSAAALNAAQIIGSTAYMLGGIAEMVSAAHYMSNASKQRHHQHSAMTAASAHMALAGTVTAASFTGLLAYSGVIAVAAASVAMPVAAFAYAGITWIKAVSSITECVHEARKLHDDDYHLSTIRKKEATVDKKYDQLLSKLNHDDLSDDAIKNIKDEMLKLKEEKEGLQAKAALIQKPEQERSPSEQKVYDAIMANQKEKVYQKASDAVSNTMLAVGFTLLAVAAVSGPAAPILVAVGIGFAAVGAAIKLSKFGFEKAAQFKAKRKIKKLCQPQWGEGNDERSMDQIKQEKMNELVCDALNLDKKTDMALVASMPEKEKLKILAREEKRGLYKSAKMNAGKVKASVAGMFKRKRRDDGQSDPDIEMKPRM